MSIGNLILGVNSVTVSYLIHYDRLSQNVTGIIITASITDIITAILLQNATGIYYKMPQIFITKCDSFITKCDDFITKCDSYYKMRRLLQIATLQFGYGVLLFTISQEHPWRVALLYLKVFGY